MELFVRGFRALTFHLSIGDIAFFTSLVPPARNTRSLARRGRWSRSTSEGQGTLTQIGNEKEADMAKSKKPAWDSAMQDGVLAWSEAKVILLQAGEMVEPEE